MDINGHLKKGFKVDLILFVFHRELITRNTITDPVYSNKLIGSSRIFVLFSAILLFLFSASILKVDAQIWFENFPEANGTTVDPQGKWTLTTPFGNDGTFYIFGNAVRANDISFGPGIFTSEPINISAYPRVYISLKIREIGVMEHFQDSISLYYTLDGGPEILWGTEADDFDNNSENWVTKTVANISGSTLRIIVKMRNGEFTEYFYLDDVGVYVQPDLYSIQSGDWDNNSTWSYSRTGLSCSCQPNALTTAVVQALNTVNIKTNVATAELVVENGGNVRWTAANFNLNIENGGILKVNAGGTLTRNGFTGANIVFDDEWKSGQVISDGTISVSSILLSNYLGELALSGTSSVDINQSIYINGNGTLFGNWYVRDPRITVTNNLGGTLNFGGNLGVASGQSGNMTFNNNKTVNLIGIFDNISTSSRFYNFPGATWNYGGSNFDTDIRLYSNFNSNLFNYAGSSNQSIITPFDAYWNLTSSGTGTKTLSGNTIVNGNLNISSGTSIQIATYDLSVSGSTSVSGTILDNSSVGTDRFIGPVTINAGGNWDYSTGNEACEFRGGLTHNGTGFNSGTGIYSFTTNTQTLGGTTAITFKGDLIVTGITLNNTNTTTIEGVLGGTGTWNNNSGSVLNYENSAAPLVANFAVNADPNTVNYSRSGDQVLRPATYHHLIVSNSGSKRFGGTINVNGNLNIENNSVLLNSGSNDIYLAGNWTDNNTADGFTEGTGEVFFNGTTQQIITNAGGTGAESFYDLTLNNSDGLSLASCDLNLSHQLSLIAGNITLVNNSNKVYLSGATPASLMYKSGKIIGKFERGITITGTYLFPIGTATNYNPANLVLTAPNTTNTIGSVLTEFLSGTPGNSGLPINEGGVEVSDAYPDGYWSVTPKNGFSSANYSINLNGNGFSTAVFESTRIIKRAAGGDWEFDGIHSNAIGTVCYRNNLTGGLSTTGTQFGFGHIRPLITDQPDIQTVCENSAASFSIVSTGYPPLTYQWYKMPGSPLTNDGHFGGVTTSTLSLPNAVLSDAGNYYCIITDGNGSAVQSTSALFTVKALPLTTAGNNGPVCTGSALNLTGGPDGMTIYSWTGPNGFTSSLQSPSVSDNSTSELEGIYTLSVTSSDECTGTATSTVTVIEQPVAIGGPDQELAFVFETQMDAELSSSETGEWSLVSGTGQINDIHSPTTTITGLSTGENIFLWKVRNGNCEASDEVKITVNEMFVPSVITPDGDGKNDYFKISEYDGKVELKIFNRWGNVEYTSINYENDWDGKNNKGSELPADTYFYILIFENGEIRKGSVLIKR